MERQYLAYYLREVRRDHSSKLALDISRRIKRIGADNISAGRLLQVFRQAYSHVYAQQIRDTIEFNREVIFDAEAA